jgi:hypothetical protein
MFLLLGKLLSDYQPLFFFYFSDSIESFSKKERYGTLLTAMIDVNWTHFEAFT